MPDPRSSPDPITFGHPNEPHYDLSPSSPFPITYLSQVYPTSTHLIQAQKFLHLSPTPSIATLIRLSPTPLSLALSHAATQRPDWDGVEERTVFHALNLKFTQNRELGEWLESTGEREIRGVDEEGREVGEVVMRVRKALQEMRKRHPSPRREWGTYSVGLL